MKVVVRGSLQPNGPVDQNRIFVGGIKGNVDEHSLAEYFGQFGTVTAVVLNKDQTTGEHKGFCYVTFEEGAGVQLAIHAYDRHEINGRWVEVKFANPPQGVVA